MIKELWQIYITGVRNIFKLKWRMTKYDFCSFLTVHFFVCLFAYGGFYFFKSAFFLFFYLILLTIVSYLAIGHRLQDMGKSGFRLLLYMVVFVACYLMCFDLVERGVVAPLERSGLLTEYLCLSYGLKYGYCLSFGVFLFLVYKWVFGDGDKNANKFGKARKQSKMSKWFIVLPLFFAVFIISFLGASIVEILYYAPTRCGVPSEVLILDDEEAFNDSHNIGVSNDSSMVNCDEIVNVFVDNHSYVIM